MLVYVERAFGGLEGSAWMGKHGLYIEEVAVNTISIFLRPWLRGRFPSLLFHSEKNTKVQ